MKIKIEITIPDEEIRSEIRRHNIINHIENKIEEMLIFARIKHSIIIEEHYGETDEIS